MNPTRLAIIPLLTLAALFAACTSSNAPAREDILTSATANLILPRYEALAADMNALSRAADALCANPTQPALDAARQSWRNARAQWLRSQSLWFGPVMERRSRSLVDWAPIEPAAIEERIQTGAITPSDAREFLPSTQRGLGAVEYLLFQPAALQTLAAAPNRCTYSAAVAATAAAETDAILAEWNGASGDREGGYAAYFDGSAENSLISKSALNDLVRISVFMSRSISDMRLGKALGVDGQIPDLTALNAGPANNAAQDIRNQILGMQDAYLGASDLSPDAATPGVTDLVRGISPDADDRMRAAFAAALAAASALQEPLPQTLAADPAPATAAYNAVKELQIRLNTEVVSLLDITVGFADTDGDGG